MTEATDEEVRECNNWLEKLRHRAASEPTGTLRVTVEQLNDIHAEYRKLLARLERVEAVIQNSKQATTACAHDFKITTGLSHNDPVTWFCCKKCNYGYWL